MHRDSSGRMCRPTLLDNTMAAWATTNGGPNAHDSKHLPLILCGGSALGLKHQGHLVQQDVPVANVWKTVVGQRAVNDEQIPVAALAHA